MIEDGRHGSIKGRKRRKSRRRVTTKVDRDTEIRWIYLVVSGARHQRRNRLLSTGQLSGGKKLEVVNLFWRRILTSALAFGESSTPIARVVWVRRFWRGYRSLIWESSISNTN